MRYSKIFNSIIEHDWIHLEYKPSEAAISAIEILSGFTPGTVDKYDFFKIVKKNRKNLQVVDKYLSFTVKHTLQKLKWDADKMWSCLLFAERKKSEFICVINGQQNLES